MSDRSEVGSKVGGKKRWVAAVWHMAGRRSALYSGNEVRLLYFDKYYYDMIL